MGTGHTSRTVRTATKTLIDVEAMVIVGPPNGRHGSSRIYQLAGIASDWQPVLHGKEFPAQDRKDSPVEQGKDFPVEDRKDSPAQVPSPPEITAASTGKSFQNHRKDFPPNPLKEPSIEPSKNGAQGKSKPRRRQADRRSPEQCVVPEEFVSRMVKKHHDRDDPIDEEQIRVAIEEALNAGKALTVISLERHCQTYINNRVKWNRRDNHDPRNRAGPARSRRSKPVTDPNADWFGGT